MTSTSQDASIAAELRDEILRGHYRCGERLPSERDLAQRFGVHRSAVREAFKRLEQLGVVSIQPGGARVSPVEEASLDVVEHLLALDDPPDPEILDQALEAISGFRAMAARLGTERANAAQRARMLSILDAMMDSGRIANDHSELVEQLADCFVEASANMVFHLMRHGLLSRRSESSTTHRIFKSAPKPEWNHVESHLVTLKKAIEEIDGATASESVYQLSRLFRQTLRAQAVDYVDASTAPIAQGGAGS